MLTCVEDKTPYSDVNFLHKKSDAPRLIKAFCEKVNTQRKDILDPSVLTKESNLSMETWKGTLQKKVSRTS